MKNITLFILLILNGFFFGQSESKYYNITQKGKKQGVSRTDGSVIVETDKQLILSIDSNFLVVFQPKNKQFKVVYVSQGDVITSQWHDKFELLQTFDNGLYNWEVCYKMDNHLIWPKQNLKGNIYSETSECFRNTSPYFKLSSYENQLFLMVNSLYEASPALGIRLNENGIDTLFTKQDRVLFKNNIGYSSKVLEILNEYDETVGHEIYNLSKVEVTEEGGLIREEVSLDSNQINYKELQSLSPIELWEQSFNDIITPKSRLKYSYEELKGSREILDSVEVFYEDTAIICARIGNENWILSSIDQVQIEILSRLYTINVESHFRKLNYAISLNQSIVEVHLRAFEFDKDIFENNLDKSFSIARLISGVEEWSMYDRSPKSEEKDKLFESSYIIADASLIFFTDGTGEIYRNGSLVDELPNGIRMIELYSKIFPDSEVSQINLSAKEGAKEWDTDHIYHVQKGNKNLYFHKFNPMLIGENVDIKQMLFAQNRGVFIDGNEEAYLFYKDYFNADISVLKLGPELLGIDYSPKNENGDYESALVKRALDPTTQNINNILMSFSNGYLTHKDYGIFKLYERGVIQMIDTFDEYDEPKYDEEGFPVYEMAVYGGYFHSGVYNNKTGSWIILPKYKDIWVTDQGFVASYDSMDFNLEGFVTGYHCFDQKGVQIGSIPSFGNMVSKKDYHWFYSKSDAVIIDVDASQWTPSLLMYDENKYKYHMEILPINEGVDREVSDKWYDLILNFKDRNRVIQFSNDSIFVNGCFITTKTACIDLKTGVAETEYSDYLVVEELNAIRYYQFSERDLLMPASKIDLVDLYSIYQHKNNWIYSPNTVLGEPIYDEDGFEMYDEYGDPLIHITYSPFKVWRKLEGNGYQLVLDSIIDLLMLDEIIGYKSLTSIKEGVSVSKVNFNFVNYENQNLDALNQLKLVTFKKTFGAYFIGTQSGKEESLLLTIDGKVYADKYLNYRLDEDGKIYGTYWNAEEFDHMEEVIKMN